MKASPLGAYSVLPVSDPHIASEPCWADPNIKGVLLRSNWSDVEDVEGVYDFGYFNTGLSLCKQYGKEAMLSVSCGQDAPEWLYGMGAKKWRIYTGGPSFMPKPWDNIFQSRLASLIAILGSTYDSEPLVVGATIWAGGRGIETFFAQSSQEIQELVSTGGVAMWVAAAEFCIHQFKIAFPSTALYLACGENFSGDHNASMTSVANYALGLGYGLQSNALTATYPFLDHASGIWYFPHTKIDLHTVALVGYQLLDPIAIIVKKTGHPQTIADVTANALAANGKWVQYYPTDPAMDPGEESLVRLNDAVGA
jgi:hypothetical protein